MANQNRVSGWLIGVVSVLLGAGAAVAAVIAVLSMARPDDSRAVQTGPASVVAPTQVIPYG